MSMLRRTLSMPARSGGGARMEEENRTLVTQGNAHVSKELGGGRVKIMARKADYARCPSIKRVTELKNCGRQQTTSTALDRKMWRSQSSAPTIKRASRVRENSSAVELLLRPEGDDEDRQPWEEPPWIDNTREDSGSGDRAYESYNRYVVDSSSVSELDIQEILDNVFIISVQAVDDDKSTSRNAKKRHPTMTGMRYHSSSGRSLYNSTTSFGPSRMSSVCSTRSQRSRRSQRSVSSRSRRRSSSPSLKSGRKSLFGRRSPSSSRRMDILDEVPEEGPFLIISEVDKKTGIGGTSKAEKEPISFFISSFFASVTSCVHRIIVDPDEICSDIYDEPPKADGFVGENMSHDDKMKAYTFRE